MTSDPPNSTNVSGASSTSSSTISAPRSENTSATNPPEYEAIIQRLVDNQRPATPAQIRATAEVKRAEADSKRADGEVRNKLAVLIFIGIVVIILTIFGCYAFVASPDNYKDIWVIIGPIITAAISGTAGYLKGEKQGSNNE